MICKKKILYNFCAKYLFLYRVTVKAKLSIHLVSRVTLSIQNGCVSKYVDVDTGPRHYRIGFLIQRPVSPHCARSGWATGEDVAGVSGETKISTTSTATFIYLTLAFAAWNSQIAENFEFCALFAHFQYTGVMLCIIVYIMAVQAVQVAWGVCLLLLIIQPGSMSHCWAMASPHVLPSSRSRVAWGKLLG